MEYLYVCHFSNGHIKVGRSIDPRARIAAHADRVSCMGVELVGHHVVECIARSAPAETELIEKQHSNIKISAERLSASGVIGTLATQEFTHNGNTYTEYRLCKRDCLILVAQNCPEFTARIVDRWQELEAQAPRFDPASLSRMDILKLAMESEQGRLEAVAERDHAIATKAQIGSKREATAMANVAKANREVARLMDRLGNNTRHATVKAAEKAAGKHFDWAPLRRWCTAHAVIAEDVPDPLYGSVKSWPADAWGEIYGIDLQELFATTQGT